MGLHAPKWETYRCSLCKRWRYAQSLHKAGRLIGLAQGSAALEGQAVGPAFRAYMVDWMASRLLRDTNEALWSPL